MRSPQDVAPRVPRARHRRRWWLLVAAIIVVVLFASLRSLATLYTDRLWFSSVNLTGVWDTLIGVKLGLFASFGGLFFVLLWVNLIVCDRMSVSADPTDPEDELVRRYQRIVRPYSNRIYAGLSVVVALIAAAGTVGQWQNWLLFTHGQSFGHPDPEFGKDIGFYVFKLPFLQFLVNWLIVSLIVILVFTVVFHYLNGGIRTQRARPRVRPVVKAHLSVLLALIALAKAAGYLLAKYGLVTSTNGFVEGAGYTDVHARIPALELLFWISLAAAAVLIWNIRRQGWTLPVLAVGLWAFVALVIGVIYPAIAQVIVNPSQNSKEAPYIARNIAATRSAYGITNVSSSKFAASASLSAEQVFANTDTLNNIRLWDPDPQISLPTFQKLQGLSQHGYYTFQGLAVDRYKIAGQTQPVVVGVRQVNTSGIASQTWVNTHLQYTHGEGIVLAQADAATAQGDPIFPVKNVPPTSSNGLPKVTQPDVYFGLNEPGFVVANTKEAEIGTGNPHYHGPGGVQLSSFFRRAAFAIRLGDFNMLISGQITPSSRVMFVRDIQAMAQKAAPFLSWDADPYAVLVNGQHRLGPRRLHHHRQLPVFAERELDPRAPGERAAGELQLRPQLGEAGHQRLHRFDDLLCDGQRSDPADLRIHLPQDVHAGQGHGTGAGRSTSATPRTSSLSRRPSTAATTSPRRSVSTTPTAPGRSRRPPAPAHLPRPCRSNSPPTPRTRPLAARSPR